MSQINVSNLTFCYDGSFDNIFENVSFSIDTNWKLGFIGRNGKGKTTFLKLLTGAYEYKGSIHTSTLFDYFPYRIEAKQQQRCAADLMDEIKPGCELWRVLCELENLKINADVLYRPFSTLSHGERTKVMLAILFSRENDFLLIDEPTNHLDQNARSVVKDYLSQKHGFILVSHDRDLLDACIDHVLVLNRKTIEVQKGNFTSWWENKTRKDKFSQAENEKHLKEIKKLKKAALQSDQWAKKNEATKIGFDPVKEPERGNGTRAYIGSKTKKLQSRVTQYKRRMEDQIAKKEDLLQDIENPSSLKLTPLTYHKETLIRAQDYCLQYKGSDNQVLDRLTFELHRGERVFLAGRNGCGKSSLIKMILSHGNMNHLLSKEGFITEKGILTVGSGLKISYINQDTSFLNGSIKQFCMDCKLEESLFCAILRQLDMERTQFLKPMEDFSEGQKKKVLIAASIMTPAHLYIWDEPLNYIDVFSRMQISQLLLAYQPTMIVVDHDCYFQKEIATRVVNL